MAPTHGTLDPQGCPLTRVTIFPEGIPARGRDFDALIDTGFTGFAQMPQVIAVDIGLTPLGTMDLTFSDGSTEAMPVAWASIRFETEADHSATSRPGRGYSRLRLPRDLAGTELAALLRRYGYEQTRQTGSHMRLTSSLKDITIPRSRPASGRHAQRDPRGCCLLS